ncbi:MAG: hypothetical protein IKN12_02790 [Selenomonadaceae bacterium]|nr:hypothetical protein [Selenomonadaceae bacterium]MBR3721666.1 hypothetical protein [Selenomonadaceae bacterium]
MKFKLKGVSLISTSLTILMLVIGFGLSAYLGSKVVQDYKTEVIMRECDVLDQALEKYSILHAGVADTALRHAGDSTNNVVYHMKHNYPESLAELGKIRDEHAFFSDRIDLSKFRYETHTDSEKGMTYTLGVHLPNGYYYKSPNSQK